MRTSRASTVLLVAALLPAAASTTAAQPASASQKAYAPARQALDGAIAAHGGLEALRAIKDIQRTGSGTAYNQGQSLRPGTPYSTRTVTVKSVSDFARGRSVTEQVTTPAGGIRTPGRAVLRGDDGFTVAVLTNVMSPTGTSATTRFEDQINQTSPLWRSDSRRQSEACAPRAAGRAC